MCKSCRSMLHNLDTVEKSTESLNEVRFRCGRPRGVVAGGRRGDAQAGAGRGVAFGGDFGLCFAFYSAVGNCRRAF